MSLMDTLKGLVGKGRDAASENADKIHGAVDKAGGFIDEKTGGKYSDQIGKGASALKNAVPEKPGETGAEPPAQSASTPGPAAEPKAPPAAEPAPPAGTASEAAADNAPEGDSKPAAEGETKPDSPQG